MAREFHPPHAFEEDACYFLTARTVHGDRILESDEKRRVLRDVLQARVAEYRIRLYAWVMLANHYHLLLQGTGSSRLCDFVRSLHAISALQLNKHDGTPGRRVWYQYWDRFVRTQRAFWSCFNYIHINPVKHGYVQVAAGALKVEGGMVKVEPGRSGDVHECLAAYPFSSYDYYLRKYGEEFLTEAWLRYPIPDHLADIEG